MASGDLNLYTPGARPPVRVVANANGDVPGRGDMVELAGETRDGVLVKAYDGGYALGALMRPPEEYDESEDYADGDVVGDSTVLLRSFVDWYETDELETLAPGDTVTASGNGVAAYDEVGGDTALEVFGVVWRTGTHAEYTSSKVAVIR